MLKKFLRHRKYKKMIKDSSSFILEEFSKIVMNTVKYFEEEGQIKSNTQKELLKFEAMILIFWIFQKTTIFEKLWHKLLLDEIHNQYYDGLKRSGYDSKMRELVSNDINLRYRTYNEAFGSEHDLTKVGIKFVRFLSERSKTELDVKDMLIPLHLNEELIPKFKEWSETMKS